MSNDFRVLQTYEELRQACENAAYLELSPQPGDADYVKGYDKWADETARRIANNFVSGLDAADE